MSQSSEWERQRREVDAYNLFYSALTARAAPNLAESGWRIPLMFPVIDDPRQGVTVEPDFVLYDGDIILLVEIKAGDNIEYRHIDQMERCDQLSIERAQEVLRDAEVQDKTPYDGSVRTIDHCIIYQEMDEDFIAECRTSDDCQERLTELEATTAVLTQAYGGDLRRLAGTFSSNRLQRIFDEGVQLPENPIDEIVLTENMEKEILAVAICDIWGEQILDQTNPVEVDVNQIRDYFAPRHNVTPTKANRVLYFLHEIGACDHRDGLEYEFSRDNISEILQIEETVREQQVEDYLEEVDEDHVPETDQTTLIDRFDENEHQDVVAGQGDEQRESDDG